jgi:hypothetical protein
MRAWGCAPGKLPTVSSAVGRLIPLSALPPRTLRRPPPALRVALQGARALRFLRKLPLLKGLSDNDLIRAASRMPQRTYRDGEALVKYGERGDELFLIRYGKVRGLDLLCLAP